MVPPIKKIPSYIIRNAKMIQRFVIRHQHIRTRHQVITTSFFGGERKGRDTHTQITPCGIQRRWKIPTFEEILNTYPRDSLPYPDAPLQLTDIQNGIYLHNMVYHNFCHCLFSQTYNIFKVQTITSDDYEISTQTEYTFQ